MFGKEESLFTLSSYDVGTRNALGWDVSPDGKRFLVLLREGSKNTTDLTNVTLASDFAEELKRLAPAGAK